MADALLSVRIGVVLDAFLTEARKVSREMATARAAKRLERLIGHAFDVQGKGFLRRLAALRPKFPEVREAIRNEDWEPLLDAALRGTRKLFVDAIQQGAEAGLLAGAAAAITDAGIEFGFTLENPEAVAYLRDYGAGRVAMIEDTTRSAIRTIIADGVEKGRSYDQVAREIGQRFAEFRVGAPQEHIRSRAHLIAITEIGDAYEHGNLLAAQALQDAGTEMEKSWLTAGDGRVSEGCRGNAAAGWIPVADDFPSGHKRPLRFPGCRCALLTRVKDAA